MGTPREEHSAVRLLDGRVLVVGGGDGDQNDLRGVVRPEQRDLVRHREDGKPHARGFRATLLPDGKVLVGDVEPGTDIDRRDPGCRGV